jgi:Tetratricopeptide repeat
VEHACEIGSTNHGQPSANRALRCERSPSPDEPGSGKDFHGIIRAMPIDAVADPLDAGDEALVSGDWEGARAVFERALAAGPSARAEEGLGRALWWLQDTEGAIAHMEGAYAARRGAGELGPAIANAL